MFTLLLCTVVVLPLCLLRSLDSLAKFGVLSILSVVFITFIVLIERIANPAGYQPMEFPQHSILEDLIEVSERAKLASLFTKLRANFFNSFFCLKTPLLYNTTQLFLFLLAHCSQPSQVKGGVISSLGTFVFAFVSQHCSHLAFDTLNEKTLENWKKVTRNSVR